MYFSSQFKTVIRFWKTKLNTSNMLREYRKTGQAVKCGGGYVSLTGGGVIGIRDCSRLAKRL